MGQELTRADLERARRRTWDNRDRDIGYLLGDPQRDNPQGDNPLTIEEWVVAAQDKRTPAYEARTTGQFELMDVLFEPGCALLHDARPREARDVFGTILVPEHRPSPAKVLSLLGLGRAHSMWRRYAFAEANLSRAMTSASSLGDPVLLMVAHTLWTLNRSDAGTPVDLEPLLAPPIVDAAPRIGTLIEAMRAYAGARVHFRDGRRRDGIALLEPILCGPGFATLAMLPRGLLLRMSGILCSVTGQSALARERLESAIAVFRQVGYVAGEVHAAFSLARLNAPIDRQQMTVYLVRAKEILENTEDDSAPPRSGARQMPAERGELASRFGEHEFQGGNLQLAHEYFQRDLDSTRSLEDVPRSLAYAERNVGRILIAMRRHAEAIKHLERSAALFVGVKDAINEFFTLYLLGDAYLEAGTGDRAEGVVGRMLKILEGKNDREKEHCIVDVLRAQVLWKHHLEIERALGVITAARSGLRRIDTDYFYVRALIVEGELLLHSRDVVSARWQLNKARRYAVSRELEDLRRQIEKLLEALGPSRAEPEPVGRMNLAILYADLRGFTSVCQVIDTAVMAEFIREFAEMIGQQASRFEGKPVRFLGDCVMAVFGLHETPYAKERMALEAACSMHARFKSQRQRWGTHHAELANIGIGFGLSTGIVVADRFGTDDLSEYSMIGEAVNLAARLQGWAADEEIIVSERAFDEITRALPDLPAQVRMLQLQGYNGERGSAEVSSRVVHAPTVWPLIQGDRSRSIVLHR